MQPQALIAVDWSGALAGVRRKLWLAEARPADSGGTPARLVRLECGRDRRETIAHLVERARATPAIVVGLDFAFSFPAWFLRERGIADSRSAWELAAREGERWLAECPWPFWGKPLRTRPTSEPGRSLFRRTEGESLPVRGIGPKSVFQVGGAGAVGTGSLRGMPALLELSAAGFSIWPFDPARLPLAVEIYPRYLTGRVAKSRALARRVYLASRCAEIERELAQRAGSCEDAFDAAISALCMARRANAFLALDGREDETFRLEGRIWRPSEEPARGRVHEAPIARPESAPHTR